MLSRSAFNFAEYTRRGPAEFPPLWADSWGSDLYGIWAEFRLPTGAAQRMRWIESGSFLMGSPENEVGRDRDEGPQHEELIDIGFWLADTACTQAMWQAVMNVDPAYFHLNNGGGALHPVERVSWFDAQDFSRTLQQILQSTKVALPTEAEWEYACRADTTTPFNFGVSCSTADANFGGNYSYYHGSNGKNRAQTVEVKAYTPNTWGLYQMHGNVWEWCADYWRNDYTQAARLAPTIGKIDGVRVLRGGSWILNAQGVRSTFRTHAQPDRRDRDIGFRFVLRPHR